MTDDIAGWVIIAPKEPSVLHGIRKSGQQIELARRKDTHSISFREDRAGRASNKGASNMCGALPNDLGEVRGLRVLRVIIPGFILPQVYPVGDGERTSSSSQVLCKTH